MAISVSARMEKPRDPELILFRFRVVVDGNCLVFRSGNLTVFWAAFAFCFAPSDLVFAL